VDRAHPCFSSSGGGRGGHVNTSLLRQVVATITLQDMLVDAGLGEPLRGVSAFRTVFPLPAEDVSAGTPRIFSAQFRSDLPSYPLSGLPVSRHECHTALVLQPSGAGAKLEEVAAGLALTYRPADKARHSQPNAGYTDRVQTHTAATLPQLTSATMQIRLPQQAWLAAKMNLGIKAVDGGGSAMAMSSLPLRDACVRALQEPTTDTFVPFDVPMTLGGVAKVRSPRPDYAPA
jgi:hypothetical protein